MTDGIDANKPGGCVRRFRSTQSLADKLPRGIFLAGSNAVFDVQHDCVRVKPQSLVDHFLPVTRDEHPRSLQVHCFVLLAGFITSSTRKCLSAEPALPNQLQSRTF